MARPVIAMLTDFGARDHYVAAMKGVALGICPDATFVDITHDIAPYDVAGAAYELAAAYAYFPVGTVFLAVVDPGVGSARRGIAAEAGGYRFVGPDNGLFTFVLDERRAGTAPCVVELTDRRYTLSDVSRTFEGRDRFAPAAAWLASGTDLASLGPAVSGWQVLEIPEPTVDRLTMAGEVVRVDRFGNLVTNIGRGAFDRFSEGGRISIRIGDHTIPGVAGTYAEAAAGALCALFGSTGHLEIAISGGSAADSLKAGRGAPVRITKGTDAWHSPSP